MISNLPSLRTRTPKEIEGILASLTLDLLPNPAGHHESSTSLDPELRERLMREIRVSLRLKQTDNSAESMGKIYGLLAEQINRAALSRVDIQDIKRRLGQRGDLAPALYKIEYVNSFFTLDQTRGVDTSQVEETLRTPDSVKHISQGTSVIGQQPVDTSVYAKSFKNKIKVENSYTLVVFCVRVGYVQKVRGAWCVFHSEFELSKARTAFDVLSLFLEKFGIELEIGGKKGKLFFNERVELGGGEDAETEVINVEHGVPIGSLEFEIGPTPDNNAVFVHWVFGVNYQKYDTLLKKHGVRIREPKIDENAQQVTAITAQRMGSKIIFKYKKGKWGASTIISPD